ncbi:MAG TPA: Nif11-like leader peptide family natural product precursor [Reyranella sp.]|nr:Nif11-like leader peptide family natural product precursor [Reyranella sp.]
MSLVDVERFLQDLQADPALLAQVRSCNLQTIVEIGARRGYSFSADEARALAQSVGALAGEELSDNQLDHVTGGWSSYKEG